MVADTVEAVEGNAVTIEVETAVVADTVEAVEGNAVTIEAETAVVADTVEAAEASAVKIAEGTIADRLDEGRANRAAGVQKERAGPADAEISRGAFI